MFLWSKLLCCPLHDSLISSYDFSLWSSHSLHLPPFRCSMVPCLWPPSQEIFQECTNVTCPTQRGTWPTIHSCRSKVSVVWPDDWTVSHQRKTESLLISCLSTCCDVQVTMHSFNITCFQIYEIVFSSLSCLKPCPDLAMQLKTQWTVT